MELKEQWVMWKAFNTLNGHYYMETVIDLSGDGFKIIVGDSNNEKKKIHIKFKFVVSSYRNTKVLYAWALQKKFLQQGSCFYKVINSNYIKWLAEISEGISTDVQPNMQHFVISTEDSTLEILDSAEPEIEFVDLP